MEEDKDAQVVPSVVPTVVSGLFDNSESDENTDYFTSDNVGHISTTVNSVGEYSHLNFNGACGYTNTSYTSDVVVSDSDSDDVDDVSRRQLLENGLTPFIKEELKYSIQTKRLKEGKQELKVQFSHPPEDVLTPEEEERGGKRRVQNRMAARRFRDKQKDRDHNLQKECSRLQSTQTELRYELAQARKERDEFRQAFDQHMAICPLQFSIISMRQPETLDNM
ncbi:uncharacterized protein LOC128245621 [Mya arenaria]|uniref:uncharacterized protein LOC128203589 n=1 Tax=Mya arenaria TaxID=6604 RepID=UPI0022E853F2|nr:uncharacterized protein LOC128203589 [Mya arenaria]XP_052761037.1 uncharacterized protein LOC128203589 [Mya arenaria]XP_052819722.1 uncharacterized protein LOC128245565 [Mya arenaria]XP_052819783.1 uncharacterized protein LOC128245621 [Mya arenaria]XP_052819784.1 uncharacterized protein LOC128245621 [Mya arenaria]